MELDREDVINLLKGLTPNSASDCDVLTKHGFMVFTGNQHNEQWSWNWNMLEELTTDALYKIYTTVKEYNKCSTTSEDKS